MKDHIIEIIDLSHEFYERDDRRPKDYTNDFLSPASEEICWYFKKFVIWVDDNCCRSFDDRFTIYQDDVDINNIKIYTIDELYQYWLINIKPTKS